MGFDTSIENSFGKYEYDKGRVHELYHQIHHHMMTHIICQLV